MPETVRRAADCPPYQNRVVTARAPLGRSFTCVRCQMVWRVRFPPQPIMVFSVFRALTSAATRVFSGFLWVTFHCKGAETQSKVGRVPHVRDAPPSICPKPFGGQRTARPTNAIVTARGRPRPQKRPCSQHLYVMNFHCSVVVPL